MLTIKSKDYLVSSKLSNTNGCINLVLTTNDQAHNWLSELRSENLHELETLLNKHLDQIVGEYLGKW